jgi:general secretion pathway protein I
MSRSLRHGFRDDGFTLIEVLVALVIVAVGMSALMSALSSSARTVSYMQDKTFAEWVALNQIATVRIALQKGQIPATGNTTGDIELASRTWHWRQEVVDSQVPGIRRIDVKVRPKDLKAGEDDSWYVTLSGLAGNSLAAPGSATISWDAGSSGTGLPGNSGTNPGTSLNNGSNNGSSGSGNTGNSGNTGSGNTTTPPGTTRQ